MKSHTNDVYYKWECEHIVEGIPLICIHAKDAFFAEEAIAERAIG